MKAGEIYVDLRLKKDKFDKGISDSQKSLKLFALEALAGVYLLDRFVEKSTNAATKLTNLSNASGVSAANLKKIGQAVSLFNSEIDQADASNKLASFAKNLYSLQKFGQGNAAGFNKLQSLGRGFSYYGKTATEVLDSLREAAKGLSDQQLSDVLADLGLEGFLPYIRATNQEVEKLTDNIGLTPDEIKRLNEADKIINSIKINWEFLQNKLVLGLSPALEELAQSLKDAGMSITGSSSAPQQTYKGWDDYLSKRGWGGFILDSLKKGVPIVSSAGKGIGETAFGGLQSIFGGDGAGNQTLKNAWDEFNRNPNAVTSSIATKSGLNNFGNLRGADGVFRSFATPQEGLNALIADITAKVSGRSRAMASRYGSGYTATLNKLISTFAPPNENNTKNYIDFVSKQTGIDPNRPLTAADIAGIVSSIVKMEGNKNITLNNTNHIHGGGDAQAIAGLIGDQLAQQLKHANADQGNGAQ